MKKITNRLIVFVSLTMLLSVFNLTAAAQKKQPSKAAAKSAAQTTKTKAPVEKVAPEPEAPAAEPEPAPPVETAAPVRNNSRAKICVAAPKTNLMPAETAPESLRNSLVKYLSGPAAEIVPLDAIVAVQQRAEAQEKGCGFYLALSVMKKKSGGGEGFGDLLKKSANAAPILTDMGAGKTAQTVSRVAQKSQTKLTTAGDLAVGIKAKDEVTLEYNLFAASDNATAASGKFKAKAGTDGEDILSGLLEKSVNDILTAAMKK